MNRRPGRAKKFYLVLGVAMALGIALNYAGLNAIKLLFTTAVINGVLGAFIYPVITVFTTLLYYDLRIRRDGFDLEVMTKELAAAPAAS